MSPAVFLPIRLMVSTMNESVSPAGFPTTHWSRVAHAVDPAAPEARAALAELAAAQYREVIRLKPDSAEAHCNLGDALNNQGDYAGALAMVRRGHELGTKQPGWRYPSTKWVAEAETRMAIAGRFAAMLKGKDSPKDNNERLVFAEIATGHKKFATATRLYVDAYAADPKAAEGMHTGNCYTAACAAAQAGSGLGDDAPPEESERARHRRLALSWLRDRLAFMAKHLEANTPSAQVDVQRWLLSWQTDRDLAGIRDPKELAKLPEAERKEWQALWAQVDAMLK
jgi:tetratricopeptide (TPR) repeat protein